MENSIVQDSKAYLKAFMQLTNSPYSDDEINDSYCCKECKQWY